MALRTLDSHTLTSITHTNIHVLTADFACACLAPRPRSTSAVSAYVILAGSLFPRINLRTQLSHVSPYTQRLHSDTTIHTIYMGTCVVMHGCDVTPRVFKLA